MQEDQDGHVGGVSDRSGADRRLPSDIFAVTVELNGGAHYFDLAIARDARFGTRIHEIAFVGRGTIGEGLDQMLVDLGVQISRAIQHRSPISGLPIETAASSITFYPLQIICGSSGKPLQQALRVVRADGVVTALTLADDVADTHPVWRMIGALLCRITNLIAIEGECSA